jgi:hypothetical protein
MTSKLTMIRPSKVTPDTAVPGTHFHLHDLSPDTVASVRGIVKKSGRKVSRSSKINGAEIAKLLMSLPPSVLKKLCDDTGD